MSQPDAELLQSLEYLIEQVRRLSQVARLLIEAMQRGERLSDSALADYVAQLRNVDADTKRMEEMVRVLWQLRGAEDGAQ